MKVYGVSIDHCISLEKNTGKHIDADVIREMNEAEKQAFGMVHCDTDQVYTLEAFFYYLNADMLDTENYYWIMA